MGSGSEYVLCAGGGGGGGTQLAHAVVEEAPAVVGTVGFTSDEPLHARKYATLPFDHLTVVSKHLCARAGDEKVKMANWSCMCVAKVRFTYVCAHRHTHTHTHTHTPIHAVVQW